MQNDHIAPGTQVHNNGNKSFKIHIEGSNVNHKSKISLYVEKCNTINLHKNKLFVKIINDSIKIHMINV